MAQATDQICAAIPAELPAGRRYVIALAGPPAAGKSTLAAALHAELGGRAAIFGLDAYHFDDAILRERDALLVKGAPHTFDVAGYAAMLRRLRDTPDAEVAVPVFDRSLELSRGSAAIAGPEHRIIITEGNWLLLNAAPWTELRPLFDLTVFVTADQATIRERILQRWTSHGFDEGEANRRAQDNDLPNADQAIGQSTAADITIET